MKRLLVTLIAVLGLRTAARGECRLGTFEYEPPVRQLAVDGSACWPTCNPPLGERPGGPNIGELGGSATPVGNHVVFSTGSGEFDCTAKMALVGGVLVVSDNQNCDGHNVRFDGVYRRVPPRKP